MSMLLFLLFPRDYFRVLVCGLASKSQYVLTASVIPASVCLWALWYTYLSPLSNHHCRQVLPVFHYHCLHGTQTHTPHVSTAASGADAAAPRHRRAAERAHVQLHRPVQEVDDELARGGQGCGCPGGGRQRRHRLWGWDPWVVDVTSRACPNKNQKNSHTCCWTRRGRATAAAGGVAANSVETASAAVGMMVVGEGGGGTWGRGGWIDFGSCVYEMISMNTSTWAQCALAYHSSHAFEPTRHHTAPHRTRIVTRVPAGGGPGGVMGTLEPEPARAAGVVLAPAARWEPLIVLSK